MRKISQKNMTLVYQLCLGPKHMKIKNRNVWIVEYSEEVYLN